MENSRINNARQLLTVAMTHREILRTRYLVREKLFVRKIHLVTRTFLLGLMMVLLSELNRKKGSDLPVSTFSTSSC